jgi:hypothetical protein
MPIQQAFRSSPGGATATLLNSIEKHPPGDEKRMYLETKMKDV